MAAWPKMEKWVDPVECPHPHPARLREAQAQEKATLARSQHSKAADAPERGDRAEKRVVPWTRDRGHATPPRRQL